MFAGMAVLGITNRPGVVAVDVGAGVCALSLGAPNNGGILIGAICGVLAGYVADIAPSRRSDEPSLARR